ncbi:MAG: F0F1 ATP synthase subunit epsilon [Patescibacteria group bacterium]|nr:F0F1 ATP synthase subunit epsilon [Patescibacteria group bacterium]
MSEQNTFHLVVASVGETRFDGAALSATIPTTGGEITILPHHEPLVATLKPGTITVREAMGEPKTFDIENGVLECSGNRAVVLL